MSPFQQTKVPLKLPLATVALLLAGLLFYVSSGGANDADTPAAQENTPFPKVTLSTNVGDIVLELDRQRAPASVENFLTYVDNDFYAQTIFHRVIEGFMIQGGGFTADFQRKQTNPAIRNEANNGLKNQKYSIAMARTNAPHSATAQFFINAKDNDFLNHRAATARDWGYAVFGRVIEGFEVVDKISQVVTGAGGPFSRDAPKTSIIIESASVTHEAKVANNETTDAATDAATVPAAEKAETTTEIK